MMKTEIGTTRSGITDDYAWEIAQKLMENPDEPIPYLLALRATNLEKRRENLRK